MPYRILKRILLTCCIFLSASAIASSRKVSFNFQEQETILTEYAQLADSLDRSLIIEDTERHDTVSARRSRILSLDLTDLAQVSSIVLDSMVNLDDFQASTVIASELPVLSMIIESGVNLNPVDTVRYIQNNEAFRRDNLNPDSQDHSRYVIIVEKQENSTDETSLKLVKVDDNLHIKETKELTPDELKNIPYIEEGVIYNAILYELSSGHISGIAAMDSIVSQVAMRLDKLLVPNVFNGISAGQGGEPVYGFWINGTGGISKQLKSLDIDAFKSRGAGGAIGFDTLLNESAVIGISYGINKSKTKFKSSSSLEHINTHILTIYTGSNEQDVTIFYSLSGGKVFVKNHRDLIYNNKPITSKHDGDLVHFSTAYSKEYDLGANFSIPRLSLEYSHLEFKPFRENGVKISKSLTRKFTVIPSITIGKELYCESLEVIPSVSYSLLISPYHKQKHSSVTILHNSQILSAVTASPKRVSHKAGVSIELVSNALKFSLSYDYLASKKNRSHLAAVAFKYQF